MEDYPFLKEMGLKQNLPPAEYEQAWQEFTEKYPLEKLAKVALKHIDFYLDDEDADLTSIDSARAILKAIRKRAKKEQ